MHDVTVMLQDRPGELARLGETLGAIGINLAGACGVTSSDQGGIHLLVDDPGAAGMALDEAGLSVRESREVLVVDARDEAGELGSMARRLSDAGVNIELICVATGTRVAFGVDDLDAARTALA